MHSGAEIPVVQTREPLGSKRVRLMTSDSRDWLCPELELHVGSVWASRGPQGLGGLMAKPCAAAGIRSVTCEVAEDTSAGNSLLIQRRQRISTPFVLQWQNQAYCALSKRFLKLSQLKRERWSNEGKVFPSLTKSRCDCTYSTAYQSIEKVNSSSKCVTSEI